VAQVAQGVSGSPGPPCVEQSCRVAFASAASSGESNMVTAGAGLLRCCHSADFVDQPEE